MQTRVSVLGDGAWGTALAFVLAQKPHVAVSIWSVNPEYGAVLRDRRENVRYLPGVPIPTAIRLTSDAEEAATADLYLLAVPTVYLRRTLARLGPVLRGEVPAVSVAKGVENETFLRPTEIIRDRTPVSRVAVLSGPSHAEEVSRGMPACVVAASDDLGLARWVQELFSADSFRVYTSQDVVGVELGGALKNIIGIAAGISDGLGLGDNAKAALLTRGLVEMARFGVAHGAEHDTFFGLAGLGDLITTSVSRHGRNYRVGLRLARRERLDDILASTPMVAEGVYTTRSVHAKATRMGLDMPITAEVFHVLDRGKDPATAVRDLMTRERSGGPAEAPRLAPGQPA